MTVSQKKLLDDVLKWETHPAFCRGKITLTNGTGSAIEIGDTLLGKLVLLSSETAGAIIYSGSTVNATDDVGVIIKKERLVAQLANSATLADVLILRRGPALVQKDGLEFTTHETNATAAMLAAGIKVVDEVGSAYATLL